MTSIPEIKKCPASGKEAVIFSTIVVYFPEAGPPFVGS
jgi:hypothetical protein